MPAHLSEVPPYQAIQTHSRDRAGDAKAALFTHQSQMTFSLSALFSFSKCRACTTAVNVRDRPVPCAKKNSHQYVENIMVPAIMSLWNQEQWIHLAINNFIWKASICACNMSLCSLRINCLTKINVRQSIICKGETLRKKFTTNNTSRVFFHRPY